MKQKKKILIFRIRGTQKRDISTSFYSIGFFSVLCKMIGMTFEEVLTNLFIQPVSTLRSKRSLNSILLSNSLLLIT